ncbi:Component of transporter for HydroxyMethylPyrimidine [Serinicoccus hydrothermalis]|uniref:Component of transporter for HydroxyMethylPyrimidine n=1 Tax=Serinicoccus hydrothermalis TaxID=1758689 RepID=A0A1B1NEC8_9MICO|nr:energy-coupling factor transporter transmembrane component T [Serinicoccus hydrothermalis]ANS79797.1 Component of transporter for HydroxyMethylPyrimidine [Serinicoccus hydrothermalis]
MSWSAAAVADGSSLARRNPTVKLAVLVSVSVAAMFMLDPLTPSVLYLLALGGVLITTRAPARTVALAHGPFLLFGLGVFVVNALSRPGTVLWEDLPVRVTVEGVEIGAALAARTLLIGVLAIGFLVSTDGVDLMTSLHQNARLDARLTYAVLAGYRMLQDMPREWALIRAAHAVRAGDPGHPGRMSRAGPLARSVFSLLVVSIRKGERMAQALESRGLGRQPRTTWRPVVVTAADWVLVVACALTLTAVLVLSAWSGQLRGPGALFG